MAQRYDVLVAGGGVVGAAAALALERQGMAVALLERGGSPSDLDPMAEMDPRVYAIAPGTARYLDELGVWKRIAQHRVSPYRRMQVWESELDHGLVFDTEGSDEDHLGFIVEDRVLRAALWMALGGVHVETACTPKSFRHEGHSIVELNDGRTIEADLVIAAEGADSSLREWAGIDTVGWDYPQQAIVCHLGTQLKHANTAYQRFLHNGPLAFLPLADGRSSIVWSTQTEEARELMALSDDAFSARVAEAFQQRLGSITSITPRQSFPLRLMHAEQYVVPGLALAGDSAHVVHPLAGQGVNLGLADVAALTEVLVDARQHKRPWSLRVLKRYERRRKAGNVEMLALTEGLFRLFGSDGAGTRALREAGVFLIDRLDPIKRPLARRAMGL